MTHIEQSRQLFARNKKKVQALLGWDDLQYGNFQFETAYDYLKQSMKLDDYWIEALTHVKGFWNWWINTWNLRDCHHYLPAAKRLAPDQYESTYRLMHSIPYIDWYPGRQIMDEAYAVMIGECWDEVKQKAFEESKH